MIDDGGGGDGDGDDDDRNGDDNAEDAARSFTMHVVLVAMARSVCFCRKLVSQQAAVHALGVKSPTYYTDGDRVLCPG